MRYTTILFDFGDTLVQVPKPAAVYRRILADHGCALEAADVERILEEARRLMDERYPRWVSDDHVLDRQASIGRRALHVDAMIRLAGVKRIAPARQAFYDVYVGTEFFTLFPDAAETLEALRTAGYRLGLVSNWESRLLQLCAAHGIAHFFDFAVVSEIEGFVKPHAELYRRAIERAGVSPDRILHVGDKLREDVEGAAQVGIHAVLVDRGPGEPAAYEPRITALRELPALLAADD